MRKKIICSIVIITITINALLAQDSWTSKPGFGGLAWYGAKGFSIGSKGYIIAGNASAGQGYDFWEYDPALNVWTQKANTMEQTGLYGIAFCIGSKGYYGLGYEKANNALSKHFWAYDPVLNTWSAKKDFSGSPRVYGAGFSIGNKAYFGMGYDGEWKKDF